MTGSFIRRLAVLLPALLLLSAPWGGEAVEYGQKPELVIESGRHSAMIRRMAIDPRGRFLASVSDDKTLRLWSLPQGTPLHILRVPIASGAEGRLYGVAVAPDGATVAAGGATGLEMTGQAVIHLFDPIDGQIKGRIPGLPRAINHLEYSGDGHLLAVGLADSGGLWVFQMPSGRMIFKDTDYQGAINWIDFSPQGGLAVAGADGSIRLYDSRLQRQAKARVFRDDVPFGIAFSPDGQRLAVGGWERPGVAVFDPKSLRLMYSADISGGTGSFQVVAWSTDGAQLLAGGFFRKQVRRVVRRWSNGGRGGFVDIPVAEEAIMAILPLADGGLAFAAADPTLGVLNSQGFVRFHHGRPQVMFQGIERRLLASQDGRTVAFPMAPGQAATRAFSLERLRMEPVEPLAQGLIDPVMEQQRGGIALQAVAGKIHVNNRPVELADGEQAQTWATDASGQILALGTSRRLRVQAATGRQYWEKYLPGAVWGLHVTGNHRWVIAALGDGTIRWFGLFTGREQLSLFPHADGQRWVAWTPANLFVTAPGAEDMVGWHVNRGAGLAPLWQSITSWGAAFRRPDLIRAVLSGG
ncbi:MAG: hypothetical protein HQL82_07335 [Magnetococcales bacterium]|nr:hypothetical protein [Magnetococcales bacterium]